MKAVHLGMGAVLAIMLGGCGFTLLPAVDIGVTSSPQDTLSYTAKTDLATNTVTYTLRANQLTFQARSGSLGIRLDDYTVDFRDSTGQPVIAGDNIAYGHIGTYVVPGLTCDNPSPINQECSLSSTNAKFGTGAPSTPINLDLLRADIAVASFELWNANRPQVGWRATVTFKGKASNGMETSFQETFGVTVGTSGASHGGLQ